MEIIDKINGDLPLFDESLDITSREIYIWQVAINLLIKGSKEYSRSLQSAAAILSNFVVQSLSFNDKHDPNSKHAMENFTEILGQVSTFCKKKWITEHFKKINGLNNSKYKKMVSILNKAWRIHYDMESDTEAEKMRYHNLLKKWLPIKARLTPGQVVDELSSWNEANISLMAEMTVHLSKYQSFYRKEVHHRKHLEQLTKSLKQTFIDQQKERLDILFECIKDIFSVTKSTSPLFIDVNVMEESTVQLAAQSWQALLKPYSFEKYEGPEGTNPVSGEQPRLEFEKICTPIKPQRLSRKVRRSNKTQVYHTYFAASKQVRPKGIVPSVNDLMDRDLMDLVRKEAKSVASKSTDYVIFCTHKYKAEECQKGDFAGITCQRPSDKVNPVVVAEPNTRKKIRVYRSLGDIEHTSTIKSTQSNVRRRRCHSKPEISVRAKMVKKAYRSVEYARSVENIVCTSAPRSSIYVNTTHNKTGFLNIRKEKLMPTGVIIRPGRMKIADIGKQQEKSTIRKDKENSLAGHKKDNADIRHEKENACIRHKKENVIIEHEQENAAIGYCKEIASIKHEKENVVIVYGKGDTSIGQEKEDTAVGHEKEDTSVGHEKEYTSLGHERESATIGHENHTTADIENYKERSSARNDISVQNKKRQRHSKIDRKGKKKEKDLEDKVKCDAEDSECWKGLGNFEIRGEHESPELSCNQDNSDSDGETTDADIVVPVKPRCDTADIGSRYNDDTDINLNNSHIQEKSEQVDELENAASLRCLKRKTVWVVKDWRKQSASQISLKAGKSLHQLRGANRNGMAFGYKRTRLGFRKYGLYPENLITHKKPSES